MIPCRGQDEKRKKGIRESVVNLVNPHKSTPFHVERAAAGVEETGGEVEKECLCVSRSFHC